MVIDVMVGDRPDTDDPEIAGEPESSTSCFGCVAADLLLTGQTPHSRSNNNARKNPPEKRPGGMQAHGEDQRALQTVGLLLLLVLVRVLALLMLWWWCRRPPRPRGDVLGAAPPDSKLRRHVQATAHHTSSAASGSIQMGESECRCKSNQIAINR